MNEFITLNEVFGRTITDIRCKFGTMDGWLDTAECYIELDRQFFIDFPHGEAEDVSFANPGKEAVSLFDNLDDIPFYHVNPEKKSIAEVTAAHKKRKQNLFNRIRHFLYGYEPPVVEYTPYKVEYQENKLKFLVNRTIINYWWREDADGYGYFELDNGYLISYQSVAPEGTGLAGLHYYESLGSLKELTGTDANYYSAAGCGSE